MTTTDNNDIVYFNDPVSGEKVSNDPRWVAEKQKEAYAAMLAAQPNTGHATPPDSEILAAKGGDVSAPQSGQPGVGEFATPADAGVPTISNMTGAMMQTEDARSAREAGFSDTEPELTPPDPVDTNKRVLDIRKRDAEEREEMLRRANEETGQKDTEDANGSPDAPYSEWTAKQLKAEMRRRKQSGRDIDLSGGKSKADVANALERDDQARAQEEVNEESDDDSNNNSTSPQE